MRILIELPTWLGDTVMVTPAIENLVGYFNDAEITLIGSFISIEALKNHPNVHKIMLINKSYISMYKFTRGLGEFDKFFSFRGSWRSNILKLLIKSNQKYQFSKTKYQKKHQVDKYNNFINDCIGQDLSAKSLIVYQDVKLSIDIKTKTVGINPGASYGNSKRWYPEEFAKVAIELSSRYEIIIFGGIDEVDIALDIERLLVERGVLNYQNLAGKTSIQELINIISQLSLFITGDSGPMHLAASFKIPTIAIFGPTNDDETSQYGFNKGIIVKKNLDCQPCMQRSCPLIHHNCMKLITAADVLAAVQRLD
jgi:heptosyltransferase II